MEMKMDSWIKEVSELSVSYMYIIIIISSMHWRHFLWVSACKESCVQYLWASGF